MNIYDAIKVLGIELEQILETDVKSAYKKASKIYHPDRNPSGEEMMKLVNEAYSTLKDADYPISIKMKDIYDYGLEINKALNSIIDLQGLSIEVCGAWVWISGETKLHKDSLKEQGFLYSGNKKMWYFRPKSQKCSWRGKSQNSIEEIRAKYGSQQVRSRKPYQLGARA